MSQRIVRTRGKDQVLIDTVGESLVDQKQLRLRRKLLIIALIILVVLIVGVCLLIRFSIDRPAAYADIEAHFKYGSIGAEPGGSLLNTVGGLAPPYWIFRAMPKVCPDLLPPGRPRRHRGVDRSRHGPPHRHLAALSPGRRFRWL